MKRLTAVLLLCILLLAGCGKEQKETQEAAYMCITAEEAKKIIDSGEDCVILDVRSLGEFEQGHIPGAMLIPDYELADHAAKLLPDKNQQILVYCRSGRRSKSAAQALVDMGYTQVRDFGGILDWPYEIE